MKKQVLVFAFLLLSSGRTGMAWELASYLEAVRAHNKDLQLAAREREMAVYERQAAGSVALPRVGFEAGYNYNFTDYYMYFDRAAMMPGAAGTIKAPLKRDNEYSASIALQQTLFNPSVGRAIKAARQYLQVTDLAYETAMQQVLSGAKKLYYQCLLLEKVLAVSRASLAHAEDNFRDLQRKYAHGQVSQLELLLAESRWRNAAPETLQAERNLRLAMNTLKNLAGVDLEQDIELAGDLEHVPPLPDRVALEEAMETRPDYQALAWEARLRKTAMQAARVAHKPTLTGTVAYAYSGQSNQFKLDEENHLWFAGIKLSLPLYTGGAIEAQVQKARVELEKTNLRMEKTRESMTIELQNIHLRMQEAKARIEAALVTLTTAEQAFRIAETTTREGLTTQLQLKDARLGYDQASIHYYAALYDYLAAYFDWELAVGRVDGAR